MKRTGIYQFLFNLVLDDDAVHFRVNLILISVNPLALEPDI